MKTSNIAMSSDSHTNILAVVLLWQLVVQETTVKLMPRGDSQQAAIDQYMPHEMYVEMSEVRFNSQVNPSNGSWVWLCIGPCYAIYTCTCTYTCVALMKVNESHCQYIFHMYVPNYTCAQSTDELINLYWCTHYRIYCAQSYCIQ